MNSANFDLSGIRTSPRFMDYLNLLASLNSRVQYAAAPVLAATLPPPLAHSSDTFAVPPVFSGPNAFVANCLRLADLVIRCGTHSLAIQSGSKTIYLRLLSYEEGTPFCFYECSESGTPYRLAILNPASLESDPVGTCTQFFKCIVTAATDPQSKTFCNLDPVVEGVRKIMQDPASLFNPSYLYNYITENVDVPCLLFRQEPPARPPSTDTSAPVMDQADTRAGAPSSPFIPGTDAQPIPPLEKDPDLASLASERASTPPPSESQESKTADSAVPEDSKPQSPPPEEENKRVLRKRKFDRVVRATLKKPCNPSSRIHPISDQLSVLELATTIKDHIAKNENFRIYMNDTKPCDFFKVQTQASSNSFQCLIAVGQHKKKTPATFSIPTGSEEEIVDQAVQNLLHYFDASSPQTGSLHYEAHRAQITEILSNPKKGASEAALKGLVRQFPALTLTIAVQKGS